MAVTLICIGIPVCRPLYKRMFQRMLGESSSGGYHKQSAGADSSMMLRTIGGGVVGPDGYPIAKKPPASGNTTDREGDGLSFTDIKLRADGPFTRTVVGSGSGKSAGRQNDQDNASDEEILDEYKRSQMQRKLSDVEGGGEKEGKGGGEGIMVTETYRVERS
jgi:hypothetical protein